MRPAQHRIFAVALEENTSLRPALLSDFLRSDVSAFRAINVARHASRGTLLEGDQAFVVVALDKEGRLVQRLQLIRLVLVAQPRHQLSTGHRNRVHESRTPFVLPDVLRKDSGIHFDGLPLQRIWHLGVGDQDPTAVLLDIGIQNGPAADQRLLAVYFLLALTIERDGRLAEARHLGTVVFDHHFVADRGVSFGNLLRPSNSTSWFSKYSRLIDKPAVRATIKIPQRGMTLLDQFCDLACRLIICCRPDASLRDLGLQA